MVKIDKIDYRGWVNSWRMSNGEVEVVVTGDVGPRVMRYGFAGGQNFFKEFAGQMGKTGEATWQPRGGHRVWIAPEDVVKSYAPDNAPVAIELHGGGVVCTGGVEALTGMEKKITVKMAPSGTAVELIHEVRNAGADLDRTARRRGRVHRRGGSAHGDGEEDHRQDGAFRNGGGIDPRGAQRWRRTRSNCTAAGSCAPEGWKRSRGWRRRSPSRWRLPERRWN